MRNSSIIWRKFQKNREPIAVSWDYLPQVWGIHQNTDKLYIEPNGKTDYWQKTHVGFSADNGHFLYTECNQDITITTRVLSTPMNQYDQAGLMIRFSENCWLKTSIEYITTEKSMLGVVVTNQGYSDWSTQVYKKQHSDIYLRIRRKAGDYFVEYLESDKKKEDSLQSLKQSWEQLRVTHLIEDTNDTSFQCGIYACSPKKKGFIAEFDFVTIDINNK
ncbi:hypothetical protein SAMN05444487_10322 [Marininema mesophilum]|uniref:DUF1349 domain-containing protein n=1 Tax=Marininema mesophilum TaxID=1048340 RepID=A0A1H2T4C6_9BACL|nr:DUF1349 domain-containing protein [Marininema mesophilum]SDW38647.1 hypothetical protein SAMN05444487_10322 [Marininema mesophilum]